MPGGTGGRTPQALAKAHERGAFGPEKTSTNAWMGHRVASTMACAYTSQNPSGYSLSRLVAKDVTLPLSTLGFQERWGFLVRVQILLLLQIKFNLLFSRGMLWMRT